MLWIYKGETFNPIDTPTYYGFIYRLLFEDNDGNEYTYYGQKKLWSNTTKTALLSGDKRKYHHRFFSKNIKGKRIQCEEILSPSTNWRAYKGSMNEIPNGLRLSYKEILMFCDTKMDLTYWETSILFKEDVLFDRFNLNMNVGGKFFAGKITGSKTYE